MINNSRSRSYSFRSFKKANALTLLNGQPSPIFAHIRNKQTSQTPEAKASYLGITYASPLHYYTNNNNQKLVRL